MSERHEREACRGFYVGLEAVIAFGKVVELVLAPQDPLTALTAIATMDRGLSIEDQCRAPSGYTMGAVR